MFLVLVIYNQLTKEVLTICTNHFIFLSRYENGDSMQRELTYLRQQVEFLKKLSELDNGKKTEDLIMDKSSAKYERTLSNCRCFQIRLL